LLFLGYDPPLSEGYELFHNRYNFVTYVILMLQ